MRMITMIFTAFVVLSSCGKVENSSSQDWQYDIVGSANFAPVQAALSAKCAGCHAWAATWSEAEYLANGYVVAGDPALSQVYYRNIGATSGPGARNMPQTGMALSNTELAQMLTWINGL